MLNYSVAELRLKYNNKKKIDYGKNDKRNGSAGLSHP